VGNENEWGDEACAGSFTQKPPAVRFSRSRLMAEILLAKFCSGDGLRITNHLLLNFQCQTKILPFNLMLA
jgi:hypothetical protein